MAAVVLGSVTYGSCDFTAAGQWCHAYVVGPRLYEKGYPDAAGVDGTGVKRYGFRERRFSFTCIYVAASAAAVVTAVSGDMNTLANIAFSITVDGTAYAACELEPSSNFSEPRHTGLASGRFYSNVVMNVVQKRLT